MRELVNYMCFHRSPRNTDEHTTPVVLLDPILAQVSHDCEFTIPTEADCMFAGLVASAMSGTFYHSDERRQAFRELIQAEFKIFLQRPVYDGAATDGSFIHLGGMLLNLVIKNEIGIGHGAIHVESAAYAAAHAFQSELVRERSVCPTLLIELAGPNMSLSGAVFTTKAICDQLTPMVSLLWQPHGRLMMQAARCFAAIRKALPSLCRFYEALHHQAFEQQAPLRQLDYPYPTSFTGPHGGVEWLLYQEKLTSRCFKAVRENGEGFVVVKFCKTYSQHAHACLASHGYAPRLIAIESLTDGWLMVVLDFVVGCAWDEAPEQPFAALKAAVGLLHQANFVHGDLRSNNILVVADNVCILDFEWAGAAGKVAYPYFMNHTDLTWPDGATDGQPVKQEHDLWWLNSLCSQDAAS